MTTKNKLVLWLILLLAAFLIGLVPQYLQKEQLRAQLETDTEHVKSMEVELKMAELRDVCGLMLLEVLRRNYGSAQDYSTTYFEKLREAAENPENSSRKKDLEELLGNRDSVTSALAQGDPASATQIQALFARTYQITRNQ